MRADDYHYVKDTFVENLVTLGFAPRFRSRNLSFPKVLPERAPLHFPNLILKRVETNISTLTGQIILVLMDA